MRKREIRQKGVARRVLRGKNMKGAHHGHNYGRVRFLLLIVLCVAGAIMGRLWFLQVRHHDAYITQANEQYIAEAEITPQRGTIFFHDGNDLYPAAINKPFDLVYIVPRAIAPEQHDTVIAFLKETLGSDGFDEKRVRAKLAKSNDPYEVVARRVEPDKSKRIAEVHLPGVHVTQEVYRFYPAGEIASQTLGFVGWDDKDYRGRYGLEASFDHILAGKKGYVRQMRDAGGRWIPLTDRVKEASYDGADLVATIDYTAQYEVENILTDAVKQYDADSGSIVIMRPDGTVITMANYPRFDPNNYGRVKDLSLYSNPIISYAYEPGSVMKTITMAIGIDAGKVTPTSTYVDTGVVYAGGYDIHNSEDKVYGLQTMTQVLENSINTGVIHVEQLVGHERFAEYFKKFGFGQKTGVRLPHESTGNIRNIEPPIRPVQFYTASFGQGITATLLQVAQSYAVIANNGILMRPRIADRTVDVNGRENVYAQEVVRRVISEETAKDVLEMLESVVVRGHGKTAAVSGYRVGGKTGTAQVAKSGEKGYDDAVTIGSFVGIAPIDEPQFIVAVRINNPKTVQWAEATAAPTFQKVMAFLLDYYNIAPTEPIEESESTKQGE